MIRGRLAPSDQLSDFAVWFGINLLVVQVVQIGAVHAFLDAAPDSVLPAGILHSGAQRVRCGTMDTRDPIQLPLQYRLMAC
jgi:hypothetical protein